MPQYMLLLHTAPHGPQSSMQTITPEAMKQMIEKYAAWRIKLQEEGIFLSGSKLTNDAGHLVRKQSGKVHVLDGPFSETKEVLAGYFLIEAATYEKAVARCQDCPHLDYGGTIEVRQVEVHHQG